MKFKRINILPATVWAIATKELIIFKRDRATFAILFLLPIIQMILYGYAINSNPKHLPMAIISADYSQFTRTLVIAMQNTHYFDTVSVVKDEASAQQLLDEGKAQFILSIPPNFTRDVMRGKKPELLLQADGSDPMAISNAVAAVNALVKTAFAQQLKGGLGYLTNKPDDIVTITVHTLYNPAGIPQYNVMPGLIGVILTGSLIILTALSIINEHSEGTFETLFAMPIKPIHIVLGKILPNIILGYLQVLLILGITFFTFHVPCHGSILFLLFICFPFIIANLALGLLFSTLARNQLQAFQLPLFYIFPSLMLTGFLFPLRSMPAWAQTIAEFLPTTHFIRIMRSIMLKGGGFAQNWSHLWPILALTALIIFLDILCFRKTLD